MRWTRNDNGERKNATLAIALEVFEMMLEEVGRTDALEILEIFLKDTAERVVELRKLSVETDRLNIQDWIDIRSGVYMALDLSEPMLTKYQISFS